MIVILVSNLIRKKKILKRKKMWDGYMPGEWSGLKMKKNCKAKKINLKFCGLNSTCSAPLPSLNEGSNFL